MKKLIYSFVAAGALLASQSSTFAADPLNSTTASDPTHQHAMHSLRISKIVGTLITNSRNESVGTVKDVVIDPDSGRVLYLAVTYGGFLGLGDKMFAVPIEAVKVVQEPNSSRTQLHLEVSKDQLQGSQGFDEKDWPNYADKGFSDDLYRRYRVENRWSRDRRDANVDVQVDRGGVRVNTAPK